MVERKTDDDVDPTVRWLVRGVWRIALGTVLVLIATGIVAIAIR